MSEHEPRNRAERRAAGRKRGVAGAMTATKVGALAAATAAAAFAGGGATPASGATTFTVTTLNDTGAGSLREAVADANSTAGADIINFQAGLTGTITLTTGQLDTITEAVDIQGPGASVITVRGTGTERIFYIDASSATFDVTISGLTLTHDATTVSGNGGAILNNVGHLTVRDAVITANTVDGDGGGIETSGDTNALTVENTTVSNNSSADGGGGISETGERADVEIINSTITGNDTDSWGGALYFYSNTGILNVAGSTLSNNTAGNGGGAGWWGGSHSRGTLTNSTVSGNEAVSDEGGGIAFYTEGVLIENSTISNNTSTDDDGGGLYFHNNEFGVEIHNSVISGNHALDGRGGGAFFYYTTGTVNIVDTTISGNDATDGGGGVYFNDDEGGSPGAVTIRNSTISGNTAGAWGGGLYVGGMLNTFKVLNSTISGNTADEEGGGISFTGYYGLVLIQDTITNNTASNYGGLYLPESKSTDDAKASAKAAHEASQQPRVAANMAANEHGAHAQLTNKYQYDGETTSIATIIAGNSGTDIGPGSTVHSDHSLFGTVGAGVTIDDKGGTLIGANPVLGPLANNGGPTETHALLTGSAAIDTGLTVEPAFPGNEFDQRGAPYDRIENGVSDIGAYEVQLVVPPPAPTPAPDVVIITPRFTG